MSKSKSFKLSKRDILHWIRAFMAYLFGGLLVGFGVTLQHLDLGIWTYILIGIGGALADLGRRFIADTENQFITQTETMTTITTTDPPAVSPPVTPLPNPVIKEVKNIDEV